MTTLRKAAQQAMEALELARDYAEGERLENERRYRGHEHLAPDDAYAVGQIDNAITALRAALAEQNRAWYTIDEINAKFDPPQRKPLTDEENT